MAGMGGDYHSGNVHKMKFREESAMLPMGLNTLPTSLDNNIWQHAKCHPPDPLRHSQMNTSSSYLNRLSYWSSWHTTLLYALITKTFQRLESFLSRLRAITCLPVYQPEHCY